MARAQFVEWRRSKLPRKKPDLELTLLELSPIGTWYYRLSCPGWAMAVSAIFRRGQAGGCACLCRLRCRGRLYDVVFYDEHGEIVAEASSVPVVPHKRAPIGSGDHSRALPPDWKNRQSNSDEWWQFRPARSGSWDDWRSAPATSEHGRTGRQDGLSGRQGPSQPQRALTGQWAIVVEETEGGPSRTARSPPPRDSQRRHRSKWSPHSRAAILRSVRRRAREERDGQPTAPPDHGP